MANWTNREQNNASKIDAEHDGDRWTRVEAEIILLWNGKSDEDLDELAALLGRTRSACAQYYFGLNAGRKETPSDDVTHRGRRADVTIVTKTTKRYYYTEEENPNGWYR